MAEAASPPQKLQKALDFLGRNFAQAQDFREQLGVSAFETFLASPRALCQRQLECQRILFTLLTQASAVIGGDEELDLLLRALGWLSAEQSLASVPHPQRSEHLQSSRWTQNGEALVEFLQRAAQFKQETQTSRDLIDSL